MGLIFIIYLSAHRQVQKALTEGWFPSSIEYYSSNTTFHFTSSVSEVQDELIYRNFVLQTEFDFLKPNEFTLLSKNKCTEQLSFLKKPPQAHSCISWISEQLVQYLVVEAQDQSVYFYTLKPSQKSNEIVFDSILFSQKEGSTLQLRKKFKLNRVPLSCLQSITVSEDQNFLLHKGASVRGILRAFLKNIKNLTIKEGGSTITQQLVKNKFLSSQRTFRRKFNELILSLILEQKLTKDEILELYLNTVYMGRNQFYSIYGFASASHHYFNKPLSQINVAECALLSILVQSPGRLNPFTNPKRALNRRNQVIQKLYENQFITQQEFFSAQKVSLPLVQKKIKTPGSYFVQSVQEKIESLRIPLNQNLKIYTTLDLDIQKKAQNAVQKALKELHKNQKMNSPLEVSLIHIDLKTNQTKALIGGRNYNQSPFNRALNAHRPIGSLVKPFVFLSAFMQDSSLQPLSLIEDKPLVQKWKPKNYKNKYYGEVPLYFALKESLNSVSAQLGIQTGLSPLISLLKKLGLQKDILKVPSITLGAIDLTPFEVTQIYSTLARMGSYQEISFVKSILDSNGNVLYKNNSKSKKVIRPEDSAVLIGMMKQVILSGTASWVHPYIPFPVAGKTGTSNDEKDSWFVGFTPDHLTTIWVGHDDNSPHGLSGTSGALLVWLYFMQNLKIKEGKDFDWPRKTRIKNVPLFSIESKKKTRTTDKPAQIELILKKPRRKFF